MVVFCLADLREIMKWQETSKLDLAGKKELIRPEIARKLKSL